MPSSPVPESCSGRQGLSNAQIASRLQWTKATVGKWRRRFVERRLPGLYDELRPGRPRSIEDEQVAALLKQTLSRNEAGTHWTSREAAASGISKSTVHRLFQAFAVQLHRSRTFKLSTDPFFVEKVRDIAGLYLNPPDHAVVLCVDERVRFRPLNRTQPVLPMALGYIEGITHDYVRHGTTTLFAALDIATGTVFTECKPRHRHQDFWLFSGDWMTVSRRNWTSTSSSTVTQPTSIPKCAPGWHGGPDIRFITPRPTHHAQSGGTMVCSDHAACASARFIPKRPGTRAEIDSFVQHYNRTSRPFVWTATANSILSKLAGFLHVFP